MKSLLYTKKLSVGYKQPLFQDLSLQFCSSQLTCLMGKNGAGKSTIIKTLSGLLQPLSGDVFIDNERLKNLSSSEISKKIGLILTHTTSVSYMTVRDLVTFGRYPYTNSSVILSENDNRCINEAIKTVGIENLKERFVEKLSDGEHQKAELARVLAQQTDLVLLDEPVAFLDFPSKIEMMHILQKLAHQNHKTVIISTHDIEMALAVADNLLIIDNQRNIISGTPEELADNGTIAHVFGTENVKFDSQIKRFHYKND